jgi:hypothetical protein
MFKIKLIHKMAIKKILFLIIGLMVLGLVQCKFVQEKTNQIIFNRDTIQIPLFGQESVKGFSILGDCLNDSGVFVTLQQDTFAGHFVDGTAYGFGKFQMREGHYLKGLWSGGRMVSGIVYDAYQNSLYEGALVAVPKAGGLDDVPHGKGKMMYNNGSIWDGFWNYGDTLKGEFIKTVRKKVFNLKDLATAGAIYKPLSKTDYKSKPMFQNEFREKYPVLQIENLHLFGEVTRFGVTAPTDKEALFGKIIRALRFQNITAEVEKRYGIEKNAILAMMMQETGGVAVLPNGQNDGGLGLCHMQGCIAEGYGLNTVCNLNCDIRCTLHGKKLTNLIASYKSDPQVLIEFDDRFHPVLNLDAVGRMLAYYKTTGCSDLKGLRPLDRAIYQYAGKWNYRHYKRNVYHYMKYLKDKELIQELETAFNENNKTLTINGKKENFKGYISKFQYDNYNYGLGEYEKLNKKNKPASKLSKKIPVPCFIVGVVALEKESDAKNVVNSLRKAGYPKAAYFYIPDHPSVGSKKFFQVYSNTFKTKKTAMNERQQIMKEPKFKNSWVILVTD